MDISIVIPAYNELDNLLMLLDHLETLVLNASYNVEVIVVDDGSTDGSGRVMREQCHSRKWLSYIAHDTNQGMGAALKTGTAQASHSLLVWLMADLSDNLDDSGPMREKLISGVDLVLASRAMEGGSYGDLFGLKALGSYLFSQCTKKMLRLSVSDLTNAFRAFHVKLLDDISLERNDFGISPEMVIKVALQGKKIEEIPTLYKYRHHGKSNFKLLHMGLVYTSLLFRGWLSRTASRGLLL